MKVFLSTFLSVFILDQVVKYLFFYYAGGIDGMVLWENKIISLVLVFNKGIAFSFLSFLGIYLKYLQVLAICIATFLLWRQKGFFLQNTLAFGLIFAGGCSNLLDRFVYGGVVDYIYWHYYFEFAVFNLADVMIDLGIFLLLYKIMIYKSHNANSSAIK
ncbi:MULTISPECIES: signal peptidase II [unclassified Helicobacter]|uniref:signal peptidase II n=1 Tax=unclassified Helicobacter TaxID=2593540 RepID=UPI001F3B8C0D|nr:MULTISPECIES: signal peptidase II [unclassified Helicobacter]